MNDAFVRLDDTRTTGSMVVFFIVVITSLVIRAIDGAWVVEHILFNHLVVSMACWFIVAWSQLHLLVPTCRLETIQAAKRMFRTQSGMLLLYVSVLGLFAIMLHYPSTFVAASPLVSFYRDQAMPWQYPLAMLVILVPFTIGYPLALIIVNKLMKREDVK